MLDNFLEVTSLLYIKKNAINLTNWASSFGGYEVSCT